MHTFSNEGPFEHMAIDPLVDAVSVLVFMGIFALRGWEAYIPRLTRSYRAGFISRTRYALTLCKYLLEYAGLGALSLIMGFAEPEPHGFIPFWLIVAGGMTIVGLLTIFIFNKRDGPPAIQLSFLSEETIFFLVLWLLFVLSMTWIYLPSSFQAIVNATTVLLIVLIYTIIRGQFNYGYYEFVPAEERKPVLSATHVTSKSLFGVATHRSRRRNRDIHDMELP